MTNRPTYAPERRPGDSLDMTDELVIFAIALDDIPTIAALIEAGAAALKYAPGSATDVVGLLTQKRNTRLGVTVARSLRAEGQRLKDRRAARWAEDEKDRKKADRDAKKASS